LLEVFNKVDRYLSADVGAGIDVVVVGGEVRDGIEGSVRILFSLVEEVLSPKVPIR
jgi:hypothetical protein